MWWCSCVVVPVISYIANEWAERLPDGVASRLRLFEDSRHIPNAISEAGVAFLRSSGLGLSWSYEIAQIGERVERLTEMREVQGPTRQLSVCCRYTI